jgi:hypothetical protein
VWDSSALRYSTRGIYCANPYQRVVLEELPGVFPAAANSWTAEILVTANKGDSLKNQITWK